MSDLPTSGSRPAPDLPRAALERVLLRAAELHSASGEVPETMSESDLLALAKEVGISPVAVKQALAEERMRVALPEERGLAASLAGPAGFAASRVVPGDARATLDRVERAFQSEQNLVVLRRFPDRIVWGPRGGLAGAVAGVAAGFVGRALVLDKADEVSISMVQVEPGKVHARIEATTAGRRSVALRTAVGGLFGGAALGAVLTALNVMAPVVIGVAAVAALLPGYIARSVYRRNTGRMQLAVEQVLDRLEFGEPKRRGIVDQILGSGQ